MPLNPKKNAADVKRLLAEYEAASADQQLAEERADAAEKALRALYGIDPDDPPEWTQED